MLLSKNKRIRQIAAVAETGNLLLLKLALRRFTRARQFPSHMYRGYLALAGGDLWPCKPILELLPSESERRIVLEHMPSRGIQLSLEQLACLALLTRAAAPRKIFEIGTYRGRTALNFALNAPDDATVFTLDLPPRHRDEARAVSIAGDAALIENSLTGSEYRGKDVEPKIKQLFGDSQTFDFSPFENEIDLVYVDGAHHYEAALSDTRNALRMVRPGGYVLWDEFGNYGDYNDVTRAVLDCLPADQVVQVAYTQLGVYRVPEADS